ncbi:hypothetical protein GCM10029964_053130 [Kibdelosporangium lantanae]
MRAVLDNVKPWRHDLAGCLHACAATLLAHHGVPPLDGLGAGWQFHYTAGDFRREEYYFPLRGDTSLLAGLAPYHRVASTWHLPGCADEGWEQVRAKVAGGTPVAVAVDNFHLPFRPAYQDVHANHLVIVYGFDDENATVRVLDAIPPLFDGDIPQDVLRAARGSANEGAHDRDMFFADQRIGHRWLEPRIDHRAVSDDRARIAAVLRRNHDAMITNGSAGPHYDGLAGLVAFFEDTELRLALGECVADELFIVAGAALSTTALHAEWLHANGRDQERPELVELGRDVERIAHHWTAVRIMAALTRTHEVSATRLARRHQALVADYVRAFAAINDLLEDLC